MTKSNPPTLQLQCNHDFSALEEHYLPAFGTKHMIDVAHIFVVRSNQNVMFDRAGHKQLALKLTGIDDEWITRILAMTDGATRGLSCRTCSGRARALTESAWVEGRKLP